MRTHRRTHRRSVRVEYVLPEEAASAGRARRLTSEFLGRPRHRMNRVGAGHIDDAALIVSELVTNATRHGRSACRLRLQRSDEQVTVEVYDDNPGQPRMRSVTTDSEGGRGLALVRCLAQRFDVAPVRGGGKRVRAVLAI
ncbi:ATP-binding protein [Streptomyces swartbergensis]|uniref:ATP-binding protein n=1 Tax=Streptomyces swartbergensis TaxID=487165 RepID=UPI001FCA368C|nr:ATP-binding protein [Streptomyces swartbergensis]